MLGQLKKAVPLFLVIALLPALLEGRAFAANSVVINEVELNPLSDDYSGNEVVELYNPTDSSVDVGGWIISSVAGKTATITIQHGTTIPAKGFFVISTSLQWLNNSNEGVTLADDGRSVVDSIRPLSDDANDDRTWQRSPDGNDKWVFAHQTLQTPDSNAEPITPSTIPPASPPNGSELKIIFIDVGQGDSTLIILLNGKTMVIDDGEPDKGNVVLSIIEKMNVTKIDAIIATHPHADHIGGLISIMDQMPVGHVYDSGQDYTTKTYFDYLRAIDRHKISYTIVHDGDALSLDPEVKPEVFNPPNPLISNSDDDISNNSVVLKLTYGNFSIMFPGDVKEAGEARLAPETNLDADVLLAALHGSSHANLIPFLKAITPETVVIYAGANNQYGFPSPVALDNFAAIHADNIFRTDQDGSIILTSDGTDKCTMHSLGSETTVVVPEFGSGILISSIAFVAIIIMVGGIMYGKRSNQGKLGPI